MAYISPYVDDLIKSFGLTSIEFIAIVIALTISISVFIIVILNYSKSIMNISYFVYSNTRVKAIGVPFVYSNKINIILDAKGVTDAANKINDAGYDINLSEIKNPEKLERALNSIYVNECENIVSSSPEKVKPFFNAYLSILESEQIKIALKSKKMKLSASDIRNRLIPTGVISDRIIDDIAESESIEDAILMLQKTQYVEVLSNAFSEYTKLKSTLPFELALDTFTFDCIRKSVGQIDDDVSHPIKSFVKIYSDISNIKMLLRAKKDNFDSLIIGKYILPGGSISMDRIKELSESKTMVELISNLKNTIYGACLERKIQDFESTDSTYPFESELDKFLLEFVLNLSTMHNLGVGPMINFIVAKQYEIRNLKAILSGLAESVPTSAIKSILITHNEVYA